MLSAGQPGFVHAPVTKVVVALVVLFTVFGSIIGSQTRLTLRLNHITKSYQFWRFITHNLVFTTPGELLFGVVLLYFFRQFERQLGSSRFTAFTLITAAFHTVFLSVAQLARLRLAPASGPYALVFASLVHFFFETPKIYHFQLLGALDLSDKTFIYFLAIQLVFSSPPRSLLSCASALAAGMLYRLPPLRDHAAMPEPLVSLCSTYLLPLLGTTPRIGTSVEMAARAHRTAVAATAAASGTTEPPTVSASNVETIAAMGFSRQQAVLALQRAHDDVQIATDYLLN